MAASPPHGGNRHPGGHQGECDWHPCRGEKVRGKQGKPGTVYCRIYSHSFWGNPLIEQWKRNSTCCHFWCYMPLDVMEATPGLSLSVVSPVE